MRTSSRLQMGAFAFMVGSLALAGPGSMRRASATRPLAAAPPAFARSAFESTWRRTDAPVASGSVRRTWFWGPGPNTGGLTEDYAQGTRGKRLVQYFDKSRMEINNPGGDPASPWYVTNGLLTVELISGRMQTG